MNVLDLTAECLDRDYHGCGKAWAAVKEDQVVALRYMGEDHTGNWPTEPELPAWVKAVRRAAMGSDTRGLPTSWASRNLAKLAAAAEAAGDCPRPPRRPRYRPTELLTMARAAILAVDGAQFGAYRERCRAELGQIGEVVSGMCSCTKFCVE
jgi:hypothetical protein